MNTLLVATAALAALAVLPARAADISGLFDTGVDASGHVLADYASDPHYTITANDGSTPPGGQAIAYNCCYSPAPSGSQWITVDTGLGSDAVNTTYETTFYVMGDPTSAVISGDWETDNHGEIFLNGADTGVHSDTFGDPQPFAISGGFVSGLNTLDFEVVNDGGPEALLVSDLSGTAGVAAAPEPATWALMVVGLSAIGGGLRSRRPVVA